MYLGRARLEEHRHDLPGGRPANDRVVDDDHALPRTSASRLNFMRIRARAVPGQAG